MSGEFWISELIDDVAVLRLDLPGKKQNILTTPVMQELSSLLEQVPAEAKGKPLAGLVITSAKEGSFIAGADIAEISEIATPEIGRYKAALGQDVFSKIAELRVPTIAAINGHCLGGGCELALACTYRIMAITPTARIGLPETKLGILPGFGGTQRLPKIVGVQKALEMILAGKLLDVRSALKAGLIDAAVAPALLFEAAVARLRARPVPARPKLGLMGRLIESASLRPLLLKKALERAEAKAHGHYPAIPAVIDVFRATLALPPDRGGVSREGEKIEAEAFARLVMTDVSRNLRALYFLDDGQKKYTPYRTEPRPIRRAAVMGAGVMGGGIAWAFSSRGVPVRVKDIKEAPLLGALAAATAVYRSETRRRRVTKAEANRGMGRIAAGVDFAGFRLADVVIEAVVEKMEIKKKALAELETHVRPDTIIATNTSGLSVTEMGRALDDPSRFGGLHFFNPVHKMPLVEIIRGRDTSDAAVATLFGVARMLGKTPILVRDAPGFLVNRILIPYMLEALRLFDEGVSPATIERVALAFGMPMGPFELADTVGLDIGLHVAEHLEVSFGERMAVPEGLKRMVADGLLGQKSGRGFYVHGGRSSRGKKLRENPSVGKYAAASNIVTMEAAEIENRLFLVMLCEAGRCLEDGVVDRPEDVEIGMIYGTGFPPHRGGLLRWGASLGVGDVNERCHALADRLGERFAPPENFASLLRTD
jgi:3-hydroxyacyl-CoA dehydrogenase / enoyl-CoA hydratase / 3-hydroxybutyryl-CoA epimerase